MVAAKFAICKGVLRTSPCPIEILITVNPFHDPR